MSYTGPEGEQAEDGGWLVGTSELQLRLQDSGKMHPVRIDTLSHDTVFSVLITPMKYCSKDVSHNAWWGGRCVELSVCVGGGVSCG